MTYRHGSLIRKLTAVFLRSTLVVGLGISAAYNDHFWLAGFGKPPSAQVASDTQLTDGAVGSVPFCVLVTEPRKYDQRVVRTTAILIAGDEQWFLYLPQCDGQDKLVWAENDLSLKLNPTINESLKARLAIKSSKHAAGRAGITMVGRFIGPGGKRFGHLDQFRMKFVITKIELIKPVSRNTAWPGSGGVFGDISAAEETIRYINREFVFHLAGARDYIDIPSEILADKFTFAGVNGDLKDKQQFLSTRFEAFIGKIYDTDIEVYVNDDTATATGLLVKSKDGLVLERYRYDNKFARNAGRWQIISSGLKSM